MSKKKIWTISGVVLVIVIVIGAIMFVANHPSKARAAKMSNEKWSTLSISDQYKLAPEGHYVHLTKHDTSLYKTSWTNKQLYKWYIDFGQDNNYSSAKSNLGTNKTFDNTKNPKDQGPLDTIWEALSDNHKFNKNIAEYDDQMYNVYFNSLKDAKNDPDVKENVSQIVR